jgi:hypothetical protein
MTRGHRYLIYSALDSASNYSAIQKLKPWLQTQDIPMKWEDLYVFYFLNLCSGAKRLRYHRVSLNLTKSAIFHLTWRTGKYYWILNSQSLCDFNDFFIFFFLWRWDFKRKSKEDGNIFKVQRRSPVRGMFYVFNTCILLFRIRIDSTFTYVVRDGKNCKSSIFLIITGCKCPCRVW